MPDWPASYGWATAVVVILTIVASIYANRKAGDSERKAEVVKLLK